MIQRLRFLGLFTIVLCFFYTPVSAQFVNFEDTWQKFLKEDKVSDISQLTKPSKEDKLDYAKYCLIYATTNYCSGNLKESIHLMSEIDNVGETVYKTIPGYVERLQVMKDNISAYKRTQYIWLDFISYDRISKGDLEKISDAKAVCEKGTLAKYSYMSAYASYCDGNIAEAKNLFENRVLKLVEKTSLKVEDVERLDEKVADMRKLFKDLKLLDAAWKQFVTTNESPGFDTEIKVIECNPVANVKAHILRGAANICDDGEDNLEKINALTENYGGNLPSDVQKQLAIFEKKVGNYSGDIAILDKAWNEFLQKDTVASGANFLQEYCRKDAQIKAYIMEGYMYTCDQGKTMLAKIGKIQKEFNPELDEETEDKLTALKAKTKGLDAEIDEFKEIWSAFIEDGDTLLNDVPLKKFYCDKITQAKSWLIKGHLDACKKGASYLNAVNKLKEMDKLDFDKETTCAIERLEQKIWDCRYWELVAQAQEETNEEREIFGMASAEIMQIDLNSDEQPCETKVDYSPLGNIGVRYVISTFLCQDIDLAKMGDPEYYKKIATWVNSQVLERYCEADMRCKEDFFIYLEGHTDGNPFNGVSYKEALDIPIGTKFTHFEDGVATEKETEREMTKSLRSNMELGIARAWTVKNQLDFMGVPISIGAYEHPRSEKGGEYRRVEIELNITNLLLDFYEKRLNELVKESGIGKRPGAC